jgi:hypothetical protein
MLERTLQTLGVTVELRYCGDGRTGHADLQEYLVDFLRAARTTTGKMEGPR